jgi:hypothetical protein
MTILIRVWLLINNLIDQSRRRFVENLPFITCPGYNVFKVVPTLGVFEKPEGNDDLHMTGCFPSPAGARLEDQVKEIQANCGCTLKTDKVIELPRPAAEELELLRSLLPAGMV